MYIFKKQILKLSKKGFYSKNQLIALWKSFLESISSKIIFVSIYSNDRLIIFSFDHCIENISMHIHSVGNVFFKYIEFSQQSWIVNDNKF